jgi:hypothetical protein
MDEHQHQVALMRWARLSQGLFPELALLYAVPNGGQRNAVVAAKLKAEGVQAGIPDLVLPVARSGYHSLYLELKRPKTGRVSELQKACHESLSKHGNAVAVAFGWERARDILIQYLSDDWENEF